MDIEAKITIKAQSSRSSKSTRISTKQVLNTQKLPNLNMNLTRTKKAIVVSAGWLGDAIACSAAASSLSEMGYKTTLAIRWPQLKSIFDNDPRFETVVYGKYLTYKIPRPIFPSRFDLIVREPKSWSYSNPFTIEIRKIAGCEPKPDYQLYLPKDTNSKDDSQNRPQIALSRDIKKRAYGRDIEDFFEQISTFAYIKWVGLDSSMNSKHGKSHSLLEDAACIKNSDLFIGPEGGLLWLAAGLGTRCTYFTEHILEVERAHQIKGLMKILGSENHFPNSNHKALRPYCSNLEAIDTIKSQLEQVNSYKK